MTQKHRFFHGLISVCTIISFTPGLVFGGQKQKAPGVAISADIAGALLQRQDGKWQAVKKGDSISAGSLLVALPKSELHSKNGAVELMMLSGLGNRGPFPVLETAVELFPNDKVDMDVRFDRGLIVLTNLKKAGAAKIKLRIQNKIWDLMLTDPGTKVGLEIYSRHLPGLPQIIGGKFEDPNTSLWLVVVKGKAVLESNSNSYALDAPPGRAVAEWDSVHNTYQVNFLKELPRAAQPPTEEEKKLYKEICSCAEHLNSRDVGPVLDEFLKSDNKLNRILGVTAAGAVDDLPRVLKALSNPKHADVRDQAVLVLRHWMGREGGQAKKLFKALTVDEKYSLVSAKTIIQLLFGFKSDEKFNPHTYDLLIAYLDHSQVAIRELARWHLVRLVPEGKDIVFDAAAPEAQRQKAIQQWRKLIPEGKLPQVQKTQNNK